jgi:hypothetical protein
MTADWIGAERNRRRHPFGFRASILLPSFAEIRRFFFRA